MPKPKIKPDIIYSGYNGRMFCGELVCAGASAYFTGNLIGGSKVVPINQQDVAELKAAGFDAKCERCKKLHKTKAE